MTKKKKILIIAMPILALVLILIVFNSIRKANEAKRWEIVMSAQEQLELNNFDEAEEILSQLNGDQFTISIKRELKTLKALQGTWKCTGQYDSLYDKVNPLDYGFAFEIEGHTVSSKNVTDERVFQGELSCSEKQVSWEDDSYGSREEKYDIIWGKNDKIYYLKDSVTDFIYTKQS